MGSKIENVNGAMCPQRGADGLIAFNTPEHIELMNADGSGRYKLPGSDDGWAPDRSR